MSLVIPPRLIHPVTVTIQRVTGATAVDPEFGEPVGTPATASATVLGQLAEQRGQRLQPQPGGDARTSNAMGHIVFEIDALTRAGVTLHKGDRITQVGTRVLVPAWRVVRIEDHVHYGGRAWHRWAFFEPEGA